MPEGEDRARLAWGVIAFGLLLELAIGVAGIAVGWMLNKENLLETLLSGASWHWIGLGAGLGLAVAVVLCLVIRLVKPLQRSRSMRILRVLQSANWLQVLLLCVVAGFAEEIFFRGALQPDIGIYATALLFGLLHAYGKLYVFLAMLAGVGLGFTYELTGSLAAAVAAHTVYNLAIAVQVKLRAFPIERADKPAEAPGAQTSEA